MTTFEGRVVDAESLAPIEGALVVAIWSEWKWGGMLARQRFRDARECLTDREGKWSFQGLSGGTRADSDGNILASFVTGYRHAPPHFYIYKKGYGGVGGTSASSPGFTARPYRNLDTGIEGIVLIIRGGTMEERQAYREMNPHFDYLPLVPADEPERRLRALDFKASYGPDTMKVPQDEVQHEGYVVHGLKKTRDVNRMRNGIPSLPVGACDKLPVTCRHKRRAHPPMSSVPTVTRSGRVIEQALPPAGPDAARQETPRR
jgi:hypothetical protein